MVNVKVIKSKWMRRYKLYLIFGLVILSIQIIISIRFVTINKLEQGNDWPSIQEKNAESINTDIDLKSFNIEKSEAHLLEDTQKSENSKNLTQLNRSNQLRLEELDFVPPCHITGKEAISAIHRAKSQKCKQVISNITCLSNAGKLYPKSIRSSCPSGHFNPGRQLGCYKDEKNFRLLNGYFGVNKKNNSPRYCINLCLQSGFQYAGVQYGYECFCGNDEPPSTSKLPDSSCNMKCPAEDDHETCGGYFTINIYETGIKKFIPQVANTETSITQNKEKKSAKIVFLLTLNGRALRQVRRLLKILYNTNHYYYIHVDVRQNYLFRELLPLEKEFSNIRLTRNRFATIWGGASLLEMLLSCMLEVSNIKDWNWDFILNLSESDYPVKSISQLTDFLGANLGKNFVKSHGREVQRFIQKQGLDKSFVECDTRMWRIGDRTLPSGIQMDGGSDWVALSRTFVKYVSQNSDELVTDLLSLFKYTLLPAESFFHTVLRNSKFCNSYIDNNLHVTNWKRKLGCKCQYKHVVDWCGCSPNDFRPEDWQRIQNTQSRQLYFARKFEPIINQAVILQLELWIHGLESPSYFVQNLHSYWQSIYHHSDVDSAKDDGLLTLAESVKRRLTVWLDNSTCNVVMNKLLEVTSYHHKDSYKNTLFKFSSSAGDLEIAVKPTSKLSIMKPSPLMEYLNTLQVNSDYDQKEQMSRNFIKILSPFSDPVFIYNFNSHRTSKVYNMTCLWIDPSGNLAELSEISIDENSLIGHAKSNLKHPILPGMWTMKLIYKTTFMASIKFLITPLQFLTGVPISLTQVGYLHGTNMNTIRATQFEKFLPTTEEKEALQDTVNECSKKHDNDLYDWIDSLTSKFYTIEKLCIVSNETSVNICSRSVESCKGTNWSSFSPDPKSAIQKSAINERTNRTFYVW